MNRTMLVVGGILLAVALAACGSSISVPLPPATATPRPPTAAPVVLLPATPTPAFSQPGSSGPSYAQWRSGMVSVVGNIKSVYHSFDRIRKDANDALYSGDTSNIEGDLQDARDTLSSAADTYHALTPPPGYRYINWVMGQAIGAYQSGINQIDRGIASNSTADIDDGFATVKTGLHDLTIIHALMDQDQWLVWLSHNENRKELPKTHTT